MLLEEVETLPGLHAGAAGPHEGIVPPMLHLRVGVTGKYRVEDAETRTIQLPHVRKCDMEFAHALQ